MRFFDDLAGLCAREMSAARKGGNTQRKAALVEALATVLGRTIAVAADGDPKAMNDLLMGCEGHMNKEAAEFAPLVQFAARRCRPK